MTRAWIFQANPSKHDIDAALEALDVISWRVPQYTAEIAAGDSVVIWRAGPEAGIVGVGTILGHPRMEEVQPVEAPFVLEPEERAVTRVPLKVRKSTFVGKREVEAMPEMAGHQILTTPRPTVYPLTAKQWSALGRLVAPPPKIDVISGPAEDIPRPFAWNDRRNAVHPLPGGYSSYIETLKKIIDHISGTNADRNALQSWLQTAFGMSESYSRFAADFLTRIGFIQDEEGQQTPSPELREWRAGADPALLIALLHARVRFIGEMLAELVEPRHPEELRGIAQRKYDLGWSGRAQIDRRRGWLESAGLVEVDDEGRLHTTNAGEELLRRLSVYEPDTVSVPESIEPEPPEQAPAPSVAVARQPGVDEIVAALSSTAHDTVDPAAFEKAVAEAFGFLGFSSVWLGGSGKTDVLLEAKLGPRAGYRVVIDCKTTKHEAVQDQQINWITLQEHRELHEADYVSVVAPAFQGSRVLDRAGGQGASLIDIDQLIGICHQHTRIPLGLEVYRQLFAAPTSEDGAASIAEAASDAERWAALVAAVTNLVTDLQRNEQSIGAGDIYWNLEEFNEEHGQATREEIETALTALSSPAIGLLINTEGGFRSLGSTRSAAERLRSLARLIDDSSEADDA